MMVYGASAAYAAPGSEGDGMSWLGYLFLGFFALIIISQVVPAAILCFGMIKGVFSSHTDKVSDHN
jgi:hypothetical protein